MGIESRVGFERLRADIARVFAIRFVDAADVIGQRSLADECSVARRTTEVSLLLVHGQHVIAFAAAIRKRLGALVAGELWPGCSRWCRRKVVGWLAIDVGRRRWVERLGVFDGQSVSGHVDDQFESVDIFVAHVAVEDLIVVVVAQVLDEALLGVQSLLAECADMLVAQPSAAGMDIGVAAGGRW